jgi:hypothetical protein
LIKRISYDIPSADTLNNILVSNNRESSGTIANNVLKVEYMNSKIIKNLKTD